MDPLIKIANEIAAMEKAARDDDNPWYQLGVIQATFRHLAHTGKLMGEMHEAASSALDRVYDAENALLDKDESSYEKLVDELMTIKSGLSIAGENLDGDTFKGLVKDMENALKAERERQQDARNS